MSAPQVKKRNIKRLTLGRDTHDRWVCHPTVLRYEWVSQIRVLPHHSTCWCWRVRDVWVNTLHVPNKPSVATNLCILNPQERRAHMSSMEEYNCFNLVFVWTTESGAPTRNFHSAPGELDTRRWCEYACTEARRRNPWKRDKKDWKIWNSLGKKASKTWCREDHGVGFKLHINRLQTCSSPCLNAFPLPALAWHKQYGIGQFDKHKRDEESTRKRREETHGESSWTCEQWTKNWHNRWTTASSMNNSKPFWNARSNLLHSILCACMYVYIYIYIYTSMYITYTFLWSALPLSSSVPQKRAVWKQIAASWTFCPKWHHKNTANEEPQCWYFLSYAGYICYAVPRCLLCIPSLWGSCCRWQDWGGGRLPRSPPVGSSRLTNRSVEPIKIRFHGWTACFCM